MKLKRRSRTDKAVGTILHLKSKRDKDYNEYFNTPVEFISSGCTTLNLALSGRGTKGGWGRARVSNIIGDGSSGKTLLALEAAFWFYGNIQKVKSKLFPQVHTAHIVYNNGEGVMDFPVQRMYGNNFFNFVHWENSPTLEHMGRDFIKRMTNLPKGESLLYIVDSWDSMGSAEGQKLIEESIKKDQDMAGSYNLAKQKYASTHFFPQICSVMGSNSKDATLIIISQVRSKIGITFGKKQYRAGGKALDFYTHMGAWISEIERIRKEKEKEKRVVGIRSKVRVERSKVAKPFRESEFVILYDYGLDDVSSMIDFLWKRSPFKFNGEKFKTKPALVKYVEQHNLENKLRKQTEKVWYEIEEKFTDEIRKRKKRY